MMIRCPTCNRVAFALGKSGDAIFAHQGRVWVVESVKCCSNSIVYNRSDKSVCINGRRVNASESGQPGREG